MKKYCTLNNKNRKAPVWFKKKNYLQKTHKLVGVLTTYYLINEKRKKKKKMQILRSRLNLHKNLPTKNYNVKQGNENNAGDK